MGSAGYVVARCLVADGVTLAWETGRRTLVLAGAADGWGHSRRNSTQAQTVRSQAPTVGYVPEESVPTAICPSLHWGLLNAIRDLYRKSYDQSRLELGR